VRTTATLGAEAISVAENSPSRIAVSQSSSLSFLFMAE
jgi:hypothetical protein